MKIVDSVLKAVSGLMTLAVLVATVAYLVGALPLGIVGLVSFFWVGALAMAYRQYATIVIFLGCTMVFTAIIFKGYAFAPLLIFGSMFTFGIGMQAYWQNGKQPSQVVYKEDNNEDCETEDYWLDQLVNTEKVLFDMWKVTGTTAEFQEFMHNRIKELSKRNPGCKVKVQREKCIDQHECGCCDKPFACEYEAIITRSNGQQETLASYPSPSLAALFAWEYLDDSESQIEADTDTDTDDTTTVSNVNEQVSDSEKMIGELDNTIETSLVAAVKEMQSNIENKKRKYVWIEVIDGRIYTNAVDYDTVKESYYDFPKFTVAQLDQECYTDSQKAVVILP